MVPPKVFLITNISHMLIRVRVKRLMVLQRQFATIVKFDIRKNIFTCLFSIHNTISLSRHEQVWATFREILLPSSGNVNDYQFVGKIQN